MTQQQFFDHLVKSQEYRVVENGAQASAAAAQPPQGQGEEQGQEQGQTQRLDQGRKGDGQKGAAVSGSCVSGGGGGVGGDGGGRGQGTGAGTALRRASSKPPAAIVAAGLKSGADCDLAGAGATGLAGSAGAAAGGPAAAGLAGGVGTGGRAAYRPDAGVVAVGNGRVKMVGEKLPMYKVKDWPQRMHFGVRLPRHNEVRHT